jgi:hypothetical protein
MAATKERNVIFRPAISRHIFLAVGIAAGTRRLLDQKAGAVDGPRIPLHKSTMAPART